MLHRTCAPLVTRGNNKVPSARHTRSSALTPSRRSSDTAAACAGFPAPFISGVLLTLGSGHAEFGRKLVIATCGQDAPPTNSDTARVDMGVACSAVERGRTWLLPKPPDVLRMVEADCRILDMLCALTFDLRRNGRRRENWYQHFISGSTQSLS